MDNTQCILQIRGLPPFFSSKFDITKHKRYNLLFDFNKANYFDVADFVAKRRKHKANLSKNTVVQEYYINEIQGD